MIKEKTKLGILFQKKDDNKVICVACAHRCTIREGKKGICNVRFNRNGELHVPWGYVAALHNDPIEKKPFYHAYPSSMAMSIGMLGCNLHCSYCQNWQISQAIRDPNAGVNPQDISAESIVNHAITLNSRAIISTYNEPLITSEWSHAIFTEAKQNGLATGYVSSGNATPEVLDFLRPVTDLYKVDLKSFNEKNYQKLGARLEHVLTSIKEIYQRGYWLELVTLLVPDFNTSLDELHQMAEFIHSISPDIPWHLSAYHADYKMTNRNTTISDLSIAAEIGKEVGLNYIYVGNVYRENKWRDTICPNCSALLVERHGFQVLKYYIDDYGKCPTCRQSIPGIWEPAKQRKRFFDIYV